ncbi:hypothetical protein ACUNWD_20485 [Sunxiuqinia sp. A32]
MKKFGLVMVGLVVLMGHVQAQSDGSQARWQAKPVVVDGNDQEWAKPLNFYDSASGLLYAISNSSDQLYLTFTVRDMLKMRKMMTAGWTMQLIAKDKKNKIKASLIFPAANMERMGDRGQDPMSGSLVKENPMIRNYGLQLGAVQVNGFQTDKSEVLLRNQNGIRIAVGENLERQLVYEIGIPLKELFGAAYTPGKQVLTLNVVVNAMSRPTGSGNNASVHAGGGQGRPQGGMRQGGGGGRMGGGMQGGGRMGGGGQKPVNGSFDRSSSFQRTSFKQKFRLNGN